ncbi:hypothetical protein ACJX0J_018661, partial [Zea mays]
MYQHNLMGTKLEDILCLVAELIYLNWAAVIPILNLNHLIALRLEEPHDLYFSEIISIEDIVLSHLTKDLPQQQDIVDKLTETCSVAKTIISCYTWAVVYLEFGPVDDHQIYVIFTNSIIGAVIMKYTLITVFMLYGDILLYMEKALENILKA